MDIRLKGGMPGMPTIPPQLPLLLFFVGGGVFAFGLLLLFNPWLLQYLVAGMFLVLGGLLLIVAWRAKRMLG